MRTFLIVALVSLTPIAASAQERTSFVQGFGGLRLTTAPETAGSLGGTVGIGLTPNIQAVGEVGRVSDVLPATVTSILAFTPLRYRVSAFYGEGGVRFTTNSSGHISAYGETLAGVTRLTNTYSGIEFSSPTADLLVDAGLRFLNTTDPIAAVGTGVVIQGGPLVATVGYRFSRIFTNSGLTGLLSGGNMDFHEVRFGVGVRF